MHENSVEREERKPTNQTNKMYNTKREREKGEGEELKSFAFVSCDLRSSSVLID